MVNSLDCESSVCNGLAGSNPVLHPVSMEKLDILCLFKGRLLFREGGHLGSNPSADIYGGKCMSLDRRRADESRLKAKARKWVNANMQSHIDNPRTIGKHYATHGASCSCFACGNPRKYFNESTIAEKIQLDRDSEI